MVVIHCFINLPYIGNTIQVSRTGSVDHRRSPGPGAMAYTAKITLISFHKKFLLQLEAVIVCCDQRPQHLRSQRVDICERRMLFVYYIDRAEYIIIYVAGNPPTKSTELIPTDINTFILLKYIRKVTI